MGKPLLMWLVDRVRGSSRIDELVVATSDRPEDDPLAELCAKAGVGCFRGDLDDVLDRFYKAAASRNPERVVRLTADCPLMPAHIVDELVDYHDRGGYDYSCNALEPTLPDGLDAEIMTLPVLAAAWKEAKLPSEREHVTSFIYNRPERFKIGSLKYPQDRSALRWTVDEPEDLELVRAIAEGLEPAKPGFTYADILDFVERNPQLKSVNTMHERNEGYKESLESDK